MMAEILERIKRRMEDETLCDCEEFGNLIICGRCQCLFILDEEIKNEDAI